MITVIEGIDGSGKTTVAKRLSDGLGHAYLKFPDRSTPIGKLIDQHLKGRFVLGDESGDGVSALTRAPSVDDALMFQALQLANRMEHGQLLDDAWNNEGVNVVCDRYYQSGIVYGRLDGLDVDHLMRMHHLIPNPDLNILVDVPFNIAIERLKARGGLDRYEEKAEYLRKVSEAYLELWLDASDKGWQGRWTIVNGNQPEDAVHKAVLAAFDDYMDSRE